MARRNRLSEPLLMLRFISIWALALLGGFTVMIALIDSQPQPVSPLMQTVLPRSTCSTTCFLGIQPGVTTQEEAIAILQANESTGQLMSFEMPDSHNGGLSWGWNERAPNIFRTADLPKGSGRITIEDGIVIDLEVAVSISAGELWLMWGKPQRYGTTVTLGPIGGPHRLGFVMVYDKLNFWFAGVVECPYYPQMWSNEINFLHWTALEQFEPFVLDNLPNPLFVQYARQRDWAECGA